MLRVVQPTVPTYHPDEAPLDCLAEILGQGNNSIFYKNFIKSRKAVAASASNSCTELSGEFTTTIVAYPGQKLSDMEEIWRKSLDEFERRGVTDNDINKFISQQEAGTIYGLESVSGKVSALASYQTFTGDANYIAKDLKRYTSVTKADVMRVYNQYIKNKPAVIVSVMTKTSEGNMAGKPNYTVNKSGYKEPNYGYNNLRYNPAKDNFDRNVVPAASGSVVINTPPIWRAEMTDGIKIIGTQSAEIPVVTILMKFKGGILTDQFQETKAGRASLFAEIMDEDTKNYTAEDFSTALEKLGSSINIYAGNDAIQVNVRSLKKNLRPTMALLQERLLRPKFTEDAFSTNKQRKIENIKNSKNQASYVASTVYNKLLFGVHNPFGRPSGGTVSSLQNISLADMTDYYENYFSAAGAEIVVVGDVSKNAVMPYFEFLHEMPYKKVELPQVGEGLVIQKTKIYLVDIPNAAQTEFRIGYLTGQRYEPYGDAYTSGIMNYPLGGAFNSRLNLDLREANGWTYGARSGFDADKYTGDFTFSSGIRAAATDSALANILSIIRTFRSTGLTDDELRFTQSSMSQSDARRYETGYQKAGFLSRILSYNLPDDYTTKQNAILKSYTTAQANALARKYVPDNNKMVILLVGDKAKIWSGLQRFGYEVVQLNSDGEKLYP